MKLMLPTGIGCLALLLTACSTTPRAGGDKPVCWMASTAAAPWQELGVTAVTNAAATAGPEVVTLDATTTYQTMDGFGGCFNELGWQALQTLDGPQREAALQALFGPDGCRFNLARAPIGANDFALGWYSLDETPGDYALKDFSIERDRGGIIAFMHAAMKYQPGLAVWGVPWSPPAWMKTNGQYQGGHMKQDPATLTAYALYFSKYVQACRAAGINLRAILPQNEPIYNNNVYPQCAWTGPELNVFLRDYLGPQLRRDHVRVEVWHGTLPTADTNFVDAVLRDPVTGPMIQGVSYQWDGQKLFQRTHDLYPDKKLMQSETECNDGQNSWAQGLTTFRKIMDDTRHFAGSYLFWNLVLNETGRSTWNWRQNSLIIVDRTAHKVIYNPEFYAMKHVSAAVAPGAKRVAVNGGPFKNVAAFRNPSGSEVLVFANDTDQPVTAEIAAAGGRWRLTAPARSMNTLTLAGEKK
jgi:glucosylceramidase